MKRLNELKSILLSLRGLPGRLEQIQNALGRIELGQKQVQNSANLHDNEFKVSSQWGEDGIIQFLLRKIKIENRVFVEFGVENYLESNTRFLLQNDNWSGLVLDGSVENIEAIKSQSIYWRHNLKAECAFIEPANINLIIEKSGLSGDIGLLSVDIDGNDYWVWNAIECVKPRIVVCEYNSLFGPQKKVTVPYQKEFARSKAHYSNLYYGASIAALEHLAKKKGYSLVGSNSAGSNAFFVRNDVIGLLPTQTAKEAYLKSRFRESRDRAGALTCLDHENGLKEIADLPLVDVESNATLKILNL